MFELDKKGEAYSLDAAGKAVVKTSHTLNKVPFLVYAPNAKLRIDSTGR